MIAICISFCIIKCPGLGGDEPLLDNLSLPGAQFLEEPDSWALSACLFPVPHAGPNETYIVQITAAKEKLMSR